MAGVPLAARNLRKIYGRLPGSGCFRRGGVFATRTAPLPF